MQNLPFSVTPEVSVKKAGKAVFNAKPADNAGGFKQVLQKQTQSKDQDNTPLNARSQLAEALKDLVSAKAENIQEDAQPNIAELDTEQEIVPGTQAEQVQEDILAMLMQSTPAATMLPQQASAVAENRLNGLKGDINANELRTLNFGQAERRTFPSLATTEADSTEPANMFNVATDAEHAALSAHTELVAPNAARSEKSLLLETALKAEAEPKLNAVADNAPAFTIAAATALPSKVVAPAVAAMDKIDVYPGHAGWNQAIGQKVVWMVGAQEQSATLTLNPPDLGPLQVVVSVNNEKADTTFISENPEVRKALEQGIPALRELLDQAGIQLGQTHVGAQSQQQAFKSPSEAKPSQAPLSVEPEARGEQPISTRVTARMSNGLIDTFA